MTDPLDYIDAPEIGALPSESDARDWPLLTAVPDAAAVNIPPAFRSGSWPVVNQGHSSTCVGQSGALTRTITEDLVDGALVSFDGYELYAACKERDNKPNDKGTSIRVALKVLKDRGALAKATPASFYPISGYVRVKLNVGEIKTALVTLGHVWVAARWCDEWNRGPLARNGNVMGQPAHPSVGHAFCLVGYDDSIDCESLGTGAFRVHNSFGKGWGDKGEAWLPYSLIGHLWEAWNTFDLPDAPVPDTVPTPPTDTTPDPVPTPAPEDAVQLLTEIVPGQVGTVSAGPVLHPSTLAPVTSITPTDTAKIIGHTADGKHYGIAVTTRHLDGPDPKLLLVPAERVTNLRVPASADAAIATAAADQLDDAASTLQQVAAGLRNNVR